MDAAITRGGRGDAALALDTSSLLRVSLLAAASSLAARPVRVHGPVLPGALPALMGEGGAMSVMEIARPQPQLTHGPDDAAHIVKQVPGRSAQAHVMEARMHGFPIEALCGHRFVPQKDALRLPLCERCKQIADRITDGRAGEIEQ